MEWGDVGLLVGDVELERGWGRGAVQWRGCRERGRRRCLGEIEAMFPRQAVPGSDAASLKVADTLQDVVIHVGADA